MIKSCEPGMQITTSEETTPAQFVFRDALNLPKVTLAESQNLRYLYFSGFLILRADKNTSPGICD